MPTLLVDSGGSFVNDRTPHGEPRSDAVARNEWVLKAESRYNYDAMNLSVNELRSMTRFLNKDDFASRSASLPILSRVVSANVVDESGQRITPQPFLVRGLTTADGKPARVAFVGLCEMTQDTPAGTKVTDPIAAAKRVLPEARSKADIVIALAHLNAADAARLAREVPGFDVIISGTGDMFTPPIRMNETLIAFTPNESRFLGELRFYRNAQGKFSVRERFISLDIGVGEDAATLKLVADAREGRIATVQATEKSFYNRLNIEKTRPKWDAATYKPAADEPPVYISSQNCYKCHAEQYLKWANSKHTKATDDLIFKKDEADASCFQCHSTGAKKADDVPQLDAVQCEQCHGPGSLHAIKPMKGYGKVTDIKTSCMACHTAQTSPKFDFQAAWLTIKH